MRFESLSVTVRREELGAREWEGSHSSNQGRLGEILETRKGWKQTAAICVGARYLHFNVGLPLLLFMCRISLHSLYWHLAPGLWNIDRHYLSTAIPIKHAHTYLFTCLLAGLCKSCTLTTNNNWNHIVREGGDRLTPWNTFYFSTMQGDNFKPSRQL